MLRPNEIQTNFSSYSGLSTAHQKGTTRLYSSRRVEHHPLFSLFSRSKKVGILSSSASSREPYFAHWSKSRIFLKNGNLWHSGTWIFAKEVELGWGANFLKQLWDSQHRVLAQRIFGVANHSLSPPSANSRVYIKKNFALKYLALIAQW